MGGNVGEQPLDMRARIDKAALAGALRCRPAGIEPVGGGDREEADVAAVLGHQPDRLDRFGRDRAGIGDDHLAIGSRPAQPVGAVDDGLPQVVRHRTFDLLDRPRGEPQIDRAAGLVAQPGGFRWFLVAVLLDIGERESEDRRQLVDEGGLEGGEPILREPDERRADRLVRAALGRERYAGRRRHQHEAGVLIAGVVERIEAARDERIIERADREQPLALDAVRQSERGEQDEQIHLGDAELDVLALGREFPVEGRGDALALEGVGHRLAREQPAPVHPRSEIGRDRHVRRGRDDAGGKLGLLLAELVEQRAEAGLRRHRRLDIDRKVGRHRDRRRLCRRSPRAANGTRSR